MENGDVVHRLQLNEPLLRDLAARLGTDDLFEWMERTAETLAALAVSRRHDDHATGFTRELLSAVGVASVEAGETVGQAQLFRAEQTAYRISYRRGMDVAAQRFAIAHEIGHTRWLAPGGRPLSPLQVAFGPDRTIEYLCNRFAAALLLPRRRFVQWLHQRDVALPAQALDVIPEAAAMFRVSEPAVAKRLLYELSFTSMTVACVRDTAEGWRTLWCSLPPAAGSLQSVAGFSVPLRRAGRVIPESMLPRLESGRSHACLLDERWWKAIRLLPQRDAKKPFHRLEGGRPRPGFARVVDREREVGLGKIGLGRSNRRVYVALPQACEP